MLNKQKLISDLEEARCKNGLSSTDIARILNVAESYITHMRGTLQISARLMRHVSVVIDALQKEQDISGTPLFEKRVPEEAHEAKERKRDIIKQFIVKYHLKLN